MTHLKHITFLFFISCLTTTMSLAQQPGTPDPSFGEEGIVRTTFGANVSSVEMQDKNILIAGVFGLNGGFSGILRLHPDGSIDNSFGTEGHCVFAFPNYSPNLSDMIVLPDNKFIVVGYGQSQINFSVDILLSKYNANGSLDSSFGENGSSYLDLGTDNYYANRCYVLEDGKIIIGGDVKEYQQPQVALIIRCLPDGTLDKSFGNNGKTKIPQDDVYNAFTTGINVQSDGKIVASGVEGVSATNGFIARFTQEGIIDSTFGQYGVVSPKLTGSQSETFEDIAVLPNNKILVAGTSSSVIFKNAQMMAVRFNADGGVDESFGTRGVTQVKFNIDAEGCALRVQPNGKLVLGGNIYANNHIISDFALTRLDKDGEVDSSFADNGRQTADFGGTDVLRNIVLQKDGKIVAAGETQGNNTALNVVRYYGDSVKQLGPIAKKIRRWIRNHTLQWQPVNDNSISYYSIQQSSNGISGFKEIGRVFAVKRQSSNVYSYDLNSSSSNSQTPSSYYRVTAVSNNGSNIVSDVIADDNAVTVTVSPNPVKNVLKLSGLPANQKTVINIVNRNGNVLQSATAQSSSYNLNVAQLKSGVYNVVVTINNKTQSIKFVKE